jgi:hypothetical protein
MNIYKLKILFPDVLYQEILLADFIELFYINMLPDLC